MTRIQIVEIGQRGMLRIYPGQQQPQAAYLELNCRDGQFSATYNAGIGDGIPSNVWHGHVRRYAAPLLQGDAANGLLAELSDVAQRVLDGYESVWDGRNIVARFSSDAQDAEAVIQDRLDNGNDGDLLQWADARNWLYAAEEDIRSDLTTGKPIDVLMEELDGDGTDQDCPVLIGLRNYLETLASEVEIA